MKSPKLLTIAIAVIALGYAVAALAQSADTSAKSDAPATEYDHDHGHDHHSTDVKTAKPALPAEHGHEHGDEHGHEEAPKSSAPSAGQTKKSGPTPTYPPPGSGTPTLSNDPPRLTTFVRAEKNPVTESSIQARSLDYTTADNVVATLKVLLAGTNFSATVAPDSASNTLLIRGGTPEELKFIDNIVQKLEEQAQMRHQQEIKKAEVERARQVAAVESSSSAAKKAATPTVKALRLKHADALSLSKQLNEIYNGDTGFIYIGPLEGQTNSLIVKANPDLQEAIAEVVKELDSPAVAEAAPRFPASWVRRSIFAADNGTITEVLVKYGDPVKEGQELFKIRPDFNDGTFTERKVVSPVNGYVETKQVRETLLNNHVLVNQLLLTIAVTPIDPPEPQLPAHSAEKISSKATTKEYLKAEERAKKIAEEYRNLPEVEVAPERVNDPSARAIMEEVARIAQKRDELKANIKSEITRAFDNRQKSQKAEVEQLRKKLDQLEIAITNREKNRQVIIDRRVEELLNPGLQWDAGAAARPVHSTGPGPTATYAEAPSDHEAILGEWKVVSGMEDGRLVTKDLGAWTIAKESITVTMDGKTKKGSYTLDSSQSPKWIDIDIGRRIAKGIYELKGNELRICVYAEGQSHARPTEFESKKDLPEDMLMVLKREK